MANAGAIRAGRAFVELFADDSKLVRGLKASEQKLKAFGNNVAAAGKSLAMIGGAALAPLMGAVKVFSDAGDKLAKMARRTGVGVEALSELSFAAGRSGSDVAALENGLRRMQRTIYDAGRGLSTAVDGLADLGLTVKDLQGLSPEEQFKLLADRIDSIEDPTMKAAAAMVIFGRSGTGLIPMMEGGAKAIGDLQKEARRLNLTLSADDAASAEVLNDALGDMVATVKGLSMHIGAALAPAVSKLANDMAATVAKVIDWIKAHRDAVIAVAKLAAGVTIAGASLFAFGKIIAGVGAAMHGLTATIKLASTITTALAGPLKAMIISIGAAIYNLTKGYATCTQAIMAWTAVITAGIAIGVGMVMLMKQLTDYTAKLSEASEQARQAGDKQRSADQTRMQRLRQLAHQERLNNEQMAEASDLIATLTGRYGDLGIALDKTTGRINGVSEAHKKMLGLMRQATEIELNNELTELRRNMAEMLKEAKAAQERIEWNPLSAEQNRIDDINEAMRKHDALYEKARAVQMRLRALQMGDEAAMTGDAPNGQAAIEGRIEASKAAADMEAQWARRVHQLRLEQIENEHQRDKALITERYQHEWDEAVKAQASEATLMAIRQAWSLEIAAADRKAAEDLAKLKREKQEEEARRQQEIDEKEKRRKEEIARANKGRRETVEELQLQASGLKGLALEKAMLELQRKRAIEAAKAAGENVALVEEEFALRSQLLAIAAQAEQAAKIDVQGVFQATNVLGLQAANVSNTWLAKIERNTRSLRDAGEASFT
jgi:hypothetical protein